jgi:hypothetical protein
VTSLSERPSRVIRGSADWQPLRLSALGGLQAGQDGGGAAARDHGGEMWARGKVGQGACFYFSMPAG